MQAAPLQLSFTIGRRTLLGWLLWVMPAPLARTTWWVGLLDLAARRLLQGSANSRRRRHAPRRELGALRAVHPPVGFGFGSVPSQPSLVHLTTMIEALRPGDGGDAA